jgi:hypothetical protein
MHDFNSAGPQRSFDLIPEGTTATVRLIIRPGNTGEGGWLRRAKDGNSEALDCEFEVIDGEFAKRKFWALFTISGTTDGHAEAARISGERLRAILESARGIKPDDKSDAAKEARRIKSYGDFDGLTFIARIGVDPPRNGYNAKNKLDRVITPNETGWHPATQKTGPVTPPSTPAKSASDPARIAKPSWAT